MCGIAGILSPDPDQRALIESMAHSLVHRGPDDMGFFRHGPMAMAQTRLSIIDLATGHQPILNEDDSLVLVCNGERFAAGSFYEYMVHKR